MTLATAAPRFEDGSAVEVAFDEEAPVLAARLVTGTPAGEPLPDLAMRLATTRGTNALLERRGASVALFVTAGFGDLLAIGNQQRDDLFALAVEPRRPLYRAVVEVDERLSSDGSVLRPLETLELEAPARRLLDRGIDCAAVALLHAYRNPAHEKAVAQLLRGLGFRHVSVSASLAPRIQILPRAETAVVNAYLSDAIESYLEGVQAAIGGGTLHVMTSSGGLVGARRYPPKDSLLSGPAGGVVGAASAGAASGEELLIAFDMGGTSTDVSRFGGRFDYSRTTNVGGARLLTPSLAIETVAAGGGSICWFDATQVRVGPESAGASPGPACYGRGGPLTLTDVNLLLGRIAAERFVVPLDVPAAEAAADELLEQVRRGSGERLERETLLIGLLEIANERMAEAIRRISTRRGYGLMDHTLVAFGGAGGQHACALASMLAMRRVLVPVDAGILSALGLRAARLERFVERSVLAPLLEAEGHLEEWFGALGREAVERVEAEGVARAEIEVGRRSVEMRVEGQEATLTVDWPAHDGLESAFAARYRTLYGYDPPRAGLEVESLRLVARSSGPAEASSGSRAQTAASAFAPARQSDPRGADFRLSRSGAELAPERLVGTGMGRLAALRARRARAWRRLRGPRSGGREAQRDGRRDRMAMPRGHGRRATARGGDGMTAASQAVELELFTHRFEMLAARMGEMLQRTALSVNVKERLDFSCALLDAEGRLVVNAPHIPVHLGALGLCVRSVAAHLELRPGDVAVTNDPAFGGSHLPDVTVITPVFLPGEDVAGEDRAPFAYVASRAHHAEIGGTHPGSMPPAATTLVEEGVVLTPRYLVRDGVGLWEDAKGWLLDAPFPSRAVQENLADLQAAVAANHQGGRALRDLAAEHGPERVARYMGLLRRAARQRIERALEAFGAGRFEATETLDDGTALAVEITIQGGSARIDFTGSGDVHPGNLNATPAIVRSVVLYVLRLLLAEPLPLNEGLMEPIELVLPPGLLNPPFAADPRESPAVVGGNVETSQRLVDTLLKALGLVACSQGTMNNTLFGNERFGYYETVCGGAGAGPGFAGASAVHTHMTNTAITDPEVLELRYPVRLERFALRHGSGGAGAFPGGDGARREIVFLEPAVLSVLGQHRESGPYGMKGGAAGKPGRHSLVRADGTREALGSVDGREVFPGDRLVLETPGGGGWGVAKDSSREETTPAEALRGGEGGGEVAEEPLDAEDDAEDREAQG